MTHQSLEATRRGRHRRLFFGGDVSVIEKSADYDTAMKPA
jgi:hypothetical protein